MNLLTTNPLNLKREMSAEKQLRFAKGIIAILVVLLLSMFLSRWGNEIAIKNIKREASIADKQQKAEIFVLKTEIKQLNNRIDQLIAISKRPTEINHYYYYYEDELIQQETITRETIE